MLRNMGVITDRAHLQHLLLDTLPNKVQANNRLFFYFA
jgi:hypothetical protein